MTKFKVGDQVVALRRIGLRYDIFAGMPGKIVELTGSQYDYRVQFYGTTKGWVAVYENEIRPFGIKTKKENEVIDSVSGFKVGDKVRLKNNAGYFINGKEARVSKFRETHGAGYNILIENTPSIGTDYHTVWVSAREIERVDSWSEVKKGDLISATRGDQSITMRVHHVGSSWLEFDGFEIETVDWTLVSIVKSATPLPTEPGYYRRNGVDYRLNDDGKWYLVDTWDQAELADGEGLVRV